MLILDDENINMRIYSWGFLVPPENQRFKAICFPICENATIKSVQALPSSFGCITLTSRTQHTCECFSRQWLRCTFGVCTHCLSFTWVILNDLTIWIYISGLLYIWHSQAKCDGTCQVRLLLVLVAHKFHQFVVDAKVYALNITKRDLNKCLWLFDD